MKYLFILFLFISCNYMAQEVTINGRVLSLADKTPLNYVTINVQGTSNGVISNEEGYFSITVKNQPNLYLIVSRIGFEQKKINIMEVALKKNVDILLEAKIITSQTILVRGSVAKSGSTPITFAKIDSKLIKQTYSTQDIPELLSYLPSMSFYSENGNGIGYNYLSIRGFDQRRISVSVNGIPQNDPEDHNVYWLDFPDLIENTEYIQVQRGSGNGIIGYPAVGGAVNIITSTQADIKKADVSVSLGSYNTRKYSAQYSSGLLMDHYSLYLKISDILSSGYRQGSWTDLKSYYLSFARYDDLLTTQFNMYGGPVSDGLAYIGLPKFAIKDKNLRTANYSDWGEDKSGYTYTVQRRPEEIENFSQPHFELLNELKINDHVTFNSALFCVLGRGFFDYDGSWADTSYLRLTHANGFKLTSNPENALIHAMVNNTQWGWIPRISIKHDDGELILGGEIRVHRSEHWGNIRSADGLPVNFDFGYQYYSFNGAKDIFSLYLHENYLLSEKINVLLETQFTHHRYGLSNEKYVGNQFDVKNSFLNPRLGINYKYDKNISYYISLAQVSREPRLVNYYDAAESSGGSLPQFKIGSDGLYDFTSPLVKPETMKNIEIGGLYSDGNLNISVNGYYMAFNDEIVAQGQIDRFGQPITGNMNKTIHYGIEFSADWKPVKNLQFIANATISKNYISEGVAYVNYTDLISGNEATSQVNLNYNTISGFPTIILNAQTRITFEQFFIQLGLRYLGDSYTDNYGSNLSNYLNTYPGIVDYSDNKIDSYFVADFYSSFETNFDPIAKKIKIYFQITNLFDNLYAAYGIGKEYFPAAERNFLMGLKISL